MFPEKMIIHGFFGIVAEQIARSGGIVLQSLVYLQVEQAVLILAGDGGELIQVLIPVKQVIGDVPATFVIAQDVAESRIA